VCQTDYAVEVSSPLQYDFVDHCNIELGFTFLYTYRHAYIITRDSLQFDNQLLIQDMNTRQLGISVLIRGVVLSYIVAAWI
jgi:hypothetical protein